MKSRPNRVLILGICGADKSTLAKQLSAKWGIPSVHLDQLYWKAGWVEADRDEFITKLESACSKEKWIIDGNFSNTLPIRLDRADLVIRLNFNRYLALVRVVKRVLLSYGRVRSDMASGCPERFDWIFMKYIWNYNKGPNLRTDEALRGYPVEKILEFRSPKELELWFEKSSQRTDRISTP